MKASEFEAIALQRDPYCMVARVARIMATAHDELDACEQIEQLIEDDVDCRVAWEVDLELANGAAS